MVNLYEMLGINISASENEIRQRIALHHSAGTMEDKYLKAAKEWLLNPDIRKKYDEKLNITISGDNKNKLRTPNDAKEERKNKQMAAHERKVDRAQRLIDDDVAPVKKLNTVKLFNPITRESRNAHIGQSWLVLLIGAFAPLVRGWYSLFLIWFASIIAVYALIGDGVFFVFFVVNIVMVFKYNNMETLHYMKDGFKLSDAPKNNFFAANVLGINIDANNTMKYHEEEYIYNYLHDQ